MALQGRKGKISFLRVNELNNVYGSPSDFLNTEVVVKLDTVPDMAFGFELRAGDPNLPARLAMLSMFRDAFVHQLSVLLAHDIEPGKKQGHLRWIEFETPAKIESQPPLKSVTATMKKDAVPIPGTDQEIKRA
jgi:hypothetical protein